ncbi:unnamed protein product (macronuclear) [Paramecium tetraurelia]|uniref:Uncharacterized protein n=1 Tax=Paramecium tetraurelia TaxID=5888 RepID=A0CG49_PARTE|nr:uncharacterized protein GSPATT00038210001 [Paramecium tetraurelia]CAK69766.1 unnamed protein product [Paramecium tetraurelia]|eukprot:XP_001437163.1 hypothetical protein (macronuclear) [Paramecium tetraurelia strain d4-2]
MVLVTQPYLRSKELGEFFRQDWFDKDKLSDLHYYKHSSIYMHIFEQYPLLNEPYEEVIQQYPESIQDFFERFSEDYKRMREHFSKKHILVVTHGYGVHAITCR